MNDRLSAEERDAMWDAFTDESHVEHLTTEEICGAAQAILNAYDAAEARIAELEEVIREEMGVKGDD